ncbi:DNA-binding domain protein [Bacteroides fragilis str. 2-F-2 |nr:DNA-binding domain protein [Bacteroides fragilis str. 2-F-2 \
MAFWKKAFAKQPGVHSPQAIVQGKPVETETIARIWRKSSP